MRLLFINLSKVVRKTLLWPLGASILLHAGFLGVRLASDHSAPSRVRGEEALPLFATLAEAPRTSAVDLGETAIDNSSSSSVGDAESPVGQPKSVPTASTHHPHYDDWFLAPLPSGQEASVRIAAPEVVAPVRSYFRRSELSVPPLLQSEPSIDVPEGSDKNTHIALRLFVSKNGEVDRVELISSTIADSDLEKEVVDAFSFLRFRPGEINGVAVDSQVAFEIDLDGLAKGTSRSSDRGYAPPLSVSSPASDKGRLRRPPESRQ